MKKVTLILVGILFISFTATAQKPFTFGIKLGADFSSYESVTDADKTDVLGYLGGAFFRFNLPKKLLIQPELYYNAKTFSIDLPSSTDPTKTESTSFNQGYFDAALLLGYRIVDNDLFKFRFMAGAFNSLNISGEDDDSGLEFDDSRIGYQVGLGVDITKITFDVRYEGATDFPGVEVALGFKFL